MVLIYTVNTKLLNLVEVLSSSILLQRFSCVHKHLLPRAMHCGPCPCTIRRKVSVGVKTESVLSGGLQNMYKLHERQHRATKPCSFHISLHHSLKCPSSAHS